MHSFKSYRSETKSMTSRTPTTPPNSWSLWYLNTTFTPQYLSTLRPYAISHLPKVTYWYQFFTWCGIYEMWNLRFNNAFVLHKRQLSDIFSTFRWHVLSCRPRVTVTSCFVYKVIKDLESMYHLCINPIHRIGLIHKWYIDSHMLNWSVQLVLHSNCKQSITSMSLLVGTTEIV